MSRQDLFHEAVKQGLIKKQWIITHDPLELEWDEVKVKVQVDLGIERWSRAVGRKNSCRN